MTHRQRRAADKKLRFVGSDARAFIKRRVELYAAFLEKTSSANGLYHIRRMSYDGSDVSEWLLCVSWLMSNATRQMACEEQRLSC